MQGSGDCGDEWMTTYGSAGGGRTLPVIEKLVLKQGQRWRVGREGIPMLTVAPRAGARFEGGHLVERPETAAA